MSVTMAAPDWSAMARMRGVDDARVRAGAHHDHLRLVLQRESLEFVVVQALVVLAHAVRDDGVELAGEIERVPVGEVAAVRQVHPEHRVAGLQQREVDRHVGLGARVRLDVGMVRPEQRLRPIDGQALDHVRELAAAVVPPAGIAFGVLVREDRSRRFKHGIADEVLGRDELETRCLALHLVADGIGNIRVGFPQAAAVGGDGQVHGYASLRSSLAIFSRRRSCRPPS
jgi:hypothetical protein